MHKRLVLAAMTASILAACATGPSDPAAKAERACGNFARIEGARPVGVDSVEPAGGSASSYRVRMRVEDALSRRITADCTYTAATDTAQWVQPLPDGFARQ